MLVVMRRRGLCADAGGDEEDGGCVLMLVVMRRRGLCADGDDEEGAVC